MFFIMLSIIVVIMVLVFVNVMKKEMGEGFEGLETEDDSEYDSSFWKQDNWESRDNPPEVSVEVVYRIQDTTMYNASGSGHYTPSEYNGIKEVDRLKRQHPDRTYRLISVNNRTGKLISVLYSR